MGEIYTKLFCGYGYDKENAIYMTEKDINEYIAKCDIAREDIINYTINSFMNPDSTCDVEILLTHWI